MSGVFSALSPHFCEYVKVNLTELFLLFFYQSFSPQMIILRVAMGRGWRKETVNELNTALVFSKPARVHGQNQGVSMTIHTIEDPVFGSGISSDRKSMSGADVVSLA
jgi:hypothetical protein